MEEGLKAFFSAFFLLHIPKGGLGLGAGEELPAAQSLPLSSHGDCLGVLGLLSRPVPDDVIDPL